jgi:hypothetical protein
MEWKKGNLRMRKLSDDVLDKRKDIKMSINVKFKSANAVDSNSHPIYSFDFYLLVKMCIGKTISLFSPAWSARRHVSGQRSIA